MGRKMVMVAGLLTNSVIMDTRMHASRVTAHGGRLLRDNIWCPIHVERPELCRRRCHSTRKLRLLRIRTIDYEGPLGVIQPVYLQPDWSKS
jgi:hypothetical protein